MPPFKFNTVTRAEISRSVGGDRMLNAIDYSGNDNVLITGCPGSGKTTVTLMRAERLANEGKEVAVFSYQNLLIASLKYISSDRIRVYGYYGWYAQKFRRWASDDNAEQMILNLDKVKNIEEVLIDEGQDFEEKIYRALKTKCDRLFVGADTIQKVHTYGMSSDEIEDELNKTKSVRLFRLEHNYRNTFETYNFARNFVPDAERVNNPVILSQMPKGNGQKPIIYQVLEKEEKWKIIKRELDEASTKNVAILVYSQNEVNFYYDKVLELGFTCSKYHNRHQQTVNIENILITTYKSAKGLEFQTVIMPDMETALTPKYKTQEHYYIGCTRAKENLILLFTGALFPAYMEGFDKNSYEFIPSEYTMSKSDLPF
ncbi:3'-5' exonuclease [Spirosoma gilvum]